MGTIIQFPIKRTVDQTQTIAEKFGLTYTQVGDYLYPNLMLAEDDEIYQALCESGEENVAEKYIRIQLGYPE